jgi:cytochrome c peroxidase
VSAFVIAHPELWYPVVHGVPQKFDDLPAVYQSNIDTQMPLDGRARGSTPPMTEQEMDDLEALCERSRRLPG